METDGKADDDNAFAGMDVRMPGPESSIPLRCFLDTRFYVNESWESWK